MLLQPLVENAVVHGIAEHPGACELEVRCALRGDRLVDPRQRRRRRRARRAATRSSRRASACATSGSGSSSSTGADHSFVFDSAPGRGARVTIDVPASPCAAAGAARLTLRVVIVDDEPLAREGVALYLEAHADVAVVASCENGSEAIRAIREHSPDLVLLDVKMPGLTGFDVIEAIGVQQMPPVIFLTAYEDYALRAFRVGRRRLSAEADRCDAA